MRNADLETDDENERNGWRERLPSGVRRPLERFRQLLGSFIPDSVWQNWKWDLLAGVFSGVYQGAVWTFAMQLARGALKATSFQMGAATAAPAVGYLFATLWARQMEGRSKLPFVTITWAISRGLFLLTPLLVHGPYAREMFLSLIVLTPIIFSVSTPAYTAIMKEIYPDQHRGRLMSFVRIGMSAAMLISARVWGLLQERYGLDYRTMFAIGGLFGVGTAWAFSRLKLPPTQARGELPPMSDFLKGTFSILKTNLGFRLFTASVFIAGFGNLVANTFYPIYQVDHFHITPLQIATMQNITNLLSLISLFFWGSFMDRFGSLSAVLVAGSIICITPITYAFGPTIGWLYLGAAAGGIAGAGIDLGYLNTTLMFAEPGRSAQYQALHSSFFGLRGTIAPLVAPLLLTALSHDWRRAFLVSLSVMITGAVFQYLSLRTYRLQQRRV